jgi:hypothetical protein
MMEQILKHLLAKMNDMEEGTEAKADAELEKLEAEMKAGQEEIKAEIKTNQEMLAEMKTIQENMNAN